MKILHNIPALRTLNQLNKVNNSSSKTMLRLSSGLRINSAADDAAGLAIGQKMDTQVKGLQQANRNALDGISMIQTAEGAYNEVHAMLQRMRELTVQAANGTYEPADKTKIADEILELQKEIVAVQERTEFNKKKLLDGSENEIMLQVGANQDQAMRMTGTDMNLDDVLTSIYGVDTGTGTFALGALPAGTTIDIGGNVTTVKAPPATTSITADPNTQVIIKFPPASPVGTVTTVTKGTVTQDIESGSKLVFKTGSSPVTFTQAGAGAGLGGGLGATAILPKPKVAVSTIENKCLIDFTDYTAASKSLGKIDQAIETASKIRGKLGAYQNRLEHTVNNLQVSEENITASMSRIMDADMAAEMADYTRQNILSQAATAMLAQANQRPEQILQLLQR